LRKIISLLFAVLLSAATVANEVAVAPSVEPEGLPPLGKQWLESNPYRGNAVAVDIGQAAYNQACARCHGADAATNAAPAPDLRKLNRYCRRIADADLNAACLRDNDAYFAKTVRQGKTIVGVIHMPAWEGVLKQELAWAIQVFVEAQSGGAQ
jgi:cytochrome c5